ncbi:MULTISPECIES: GAF domain-containing protein [Carnobacterium]|jgi:GAF domain-containing protein|uniref:GAF domain-containing protein n=2 Tax=Carnobacterium maltaromaticum TaxID=2751 RepID=K8E3F9_CARML|nr:GAF domain-containing protein [Carnobacterium maltaromaticum]AOA01687.1 histidine kinase [Carnobacterium maltaromaticum]KRN64881.1 protein YtsP [Carnobacterium maltaromaticum DSM 20342]KRN73932.1 protein YtsP [Carnobacterium maltaromaticum]KRN87434.1 protein YtsP [Carnobacterium maltaromaticum]MBC9786904.1 GAF domain-containing protein [Carnobacterium maltaromaticum]
MTKAQDYRLTNAQLEAIIGDETNLIANLSNAAALLFENLKDINWSGFYLFEEASGELVLGPFQGKVACIRIPVGRGVCGTAFQKKESLFVNDVHEFPGHIACDARSQSEIVIPLEKNGKIIGVLDIDAPIKARFDQEDQEHLETFVQLLLKNSSL